MDVEGKQPSLNGDVRVEVLVSNLALVHELILLVEPSSIRDLSVEVVPTLDARATFMHDII